MNFNELLLQLENPQVFTGKEINVIKNKFNKRDINICLVFPDTYEIGMSHYGIKILYHFLNHIPRVNAERCFLPGHRSIPLFQSTDISLFSLENRISLKEFDLLAFSLLSEMNYTNVLLALELARIPLKSEDRNEEHPLIAGGGISAVNPEPLREFLDFFGIGDGEVLFPEIIHTLDRCKRENRSRRKTLALMDTIKGVYVPSLYSVVEKGRFHLPDLKQKKIRKRILSNINDSFPEPNIIVPISNVVFDRLNVEIARGCLQTCRFCQARSYYSPYRHRSVKDTLGFLDRALKRTGFEVFSLTSLSSGDYPELGELLGRIPATIPECTSFSVSSLRPSTLTQRLLSTIAMFRRTGITIVPEAGTQRLRRVINKDVSDNQIFSAVDAAMEKGWKQIKLYFMIGLPGETIEDIQAIIELIESILKIARTKKKRIKIHTSISNFVPKPHTPFQWAGRESLESLLEKSEIIKNGLKTYRNVQFDFHNVFRGVIETILSRGDARTGEFINEAFKKGEIFSAWDGHFHFHQWEPLIKKLGMEEFLKEYSPDESLPWDFIEINYHKDYLLREYRKSRDAGPTPGCSPDRCPACRGCATPIQKFKASPAAPTSEPAVKAEITAPPDFNRVRVYYEKSGDFRFFSHLALIKYIERLIRKAGIPFKCTEGFHPRMKASYLQPLPVYARGYNEVMELWIDKKMSETEILSVLKKASPDFIFLKARICNACRPLNRDIRFMDYEISSDNPTENLQDIKKFLLETDRAAVNENTLELRIDYTRQGQERFAKIYKTIDPERKKTYHLTRKQVIFVND